MVRVLGSQALVRLGPWVALVALVWTAGTWAS